MPDDDKLNLIKYRIARTAVLVGALTFSLGRSYIGWSAVDKAIEWGAAIYLEHKSVSDSEIEDQLKDSPFKLSEKDIELVKDMIRDLEKKNVPNGDIRRFLYSMKYVYNSDEMKELHTLYFKGCSYDKLKDAKRLLKALEWDIESIRNWLKIEGYKEVLDYTIKAKGEIEELEKTGLDMREVKTQLLELRKKYESLSRLKRGN